MSIDVMCVSLIRCIYRLVGDARATEWNQTLALPRAKSWALQWKQVTLENEKGMRWEEREEKSERSNNSTENQMRRTTNVIGAVWTTVKTSSSTYPLLFTSFSFSSSLVSTLVFHFYFRFSRYTHAKAKENAFRRQHAVTLVTLILTKMPRHDLCCTSYIFHFAASIQLTLTFRSHTQSKAINPCCPLNVRH